MLYSFANFAISDDARCLTNGPFGQSNHHLRMILYDNGFVKLDYDPSADILHVDCPDMHEYELLFIHQIVGVVVETLVNYNIKHFMLDTSRTATDMSPENHGIVMSHFATELAATRLRKFARVVSKDTAREKRVEAFVKAFYEEEKPEIALRNFTRKAAAIRWLTAG